MIFEMHDRIREILTEYNDTLIGRCPICLEEFNESNSGSLLFSERPDLVRVDKCYHRYHLKCLYRDWFMQRKIEKDEYGCDIVYKMPKKKKCPTCRRVVSEEEFNYI